MKEARTGTCRFEVAVLTGLHAGARILLDGRSHTVIGRDLACDLTLRDVTVSARHLMLVALDGKIKAVALEGEIEVNGLPVPDGKERVLRRGERIKLGDVSIGLGEPGALWDTLDAIDMVPASSRLARFRHWLAQGERRRRTAAAMIFGGAGLCVLLPLMFAITQWGKRSEIAAPDEAAQMRQIEQRLVAMKLPGLRVFVDQTIHAIVVEGYVSYDEDIRRAEKVALSMKARPTLRLYSREQIERQAREYVARELPGAVVRSVEMGAVRIESTKALLPRFKDWLREQMARDIPGVRTIAFDGPDYSRIQEVTPDPLAILSIGSVRFLLAKDGERFFPGAELSKGVSLVRIGSKSIFVERAEVE
ncbi:phosphopeptide-binding protein [Burkholderia ubonensis]|uniref:FHA domain-containing protein n=1 Tax=Burkholderia ubonensis TaxID=101571 RepID=UPI0007525796|nr:FHA domain-containing protein [Burkholderia ubonensis]KVD55007.1 phosphopeptide-binding protein [Burkholderia ubonensis]